jgi:sulfatase modifying factor 1
MLWLFACAEPELQIRRWAPPAVADHTGTFDPGAHSGSTAETGSAGGPCPADMVWTGGVCIDRYEAFLAGGSPFEVPGSALPAENRAGEVPQAYISAVVAADSCSLAGKRLCTSDEWLSACRGAEERLFPYGDTYDPSACNDTRSSHPVIDVFGAGASFDDTELNDPRLNQLPDSLAASGEFGACVTPDGVADLHGNLHEWVADLDGTFRGGFYVDAEINGPGCTYTTTAHDPGYHDYSTGFRCCVDPRP